MIQNEMKDSLGRFRTLSLFKELCLEHETLKPVYTLQEKDAHGLPSAYKIYMKHNTEYAAALELVGSWQHWQRLLKCALFAQYLNKWREDKEAELFSFGIDCMIESARQGSTAACKWLTDKGWKKSTSKKDKELMNTAIVINDVGDEIARISELSKVA